MFTRNLRSIVLLPAAFLLAAAPMIHAEEGMWTFDNPPLKQLAAKYDFHPTQAWLDHLRLSSVRLNDGGSGSFVSPNGLLLTNHHVARGQLQKNSTAEHDYVRDGFYATTSDEEMKSPDLEVNVLVAMQDVTARVQGAAKGIADEAKALKARDAEIAAIEKESKDKTGLRSDVVSLYQGGEYWLYQYKAYTDVRLVFAPEQQAAFFGGDPDNFTYPRYDLDMALFRVYDNGKPLHTDNYLKWSAKGAAPGELIFISGHPGSTQRDDTVAAVAHGARLFAARRSPNTSSAASPQPRPLPPRGRNRRALSAATIFGLQNSLKVYLGRARGPGRPGDPGQEAGRGRPTSAPRWPPIPNGRRPTAAHGTQIAAAEEKVKPEIKARSSAAPTARLFTIALELVQYVAEIKKPDGERLDQFHDAGLESLRYQLLSPAPIYPSTEKLYMTTRSLAGRREDGQGRRLLCRPSCKAAISTQPPMP